MFSPPREVPEWNRQTFFEGAEFGWVGLLALNEQQDIIAYFPKKSRGMGKKSIFRRFF